MSHRPPVQHGSPRRSSALRWVVGALVVVTAASAAGCRVPPALSVSPVVDGLDHPWDMAFTPNGDMLFTERSGRINVLTGGTRRVLALPADVHPVGEGGMMGLAVDPGFAVNRRIYACFLADHSGSLDVRVARWRVNDALTGLTDRVDIVTGIPVNATGEPGRHSGCRPRFGPDGNLWIGTGDAASSTNPQDPASLGGKVLRVDTDGRGVAGNAAAPFRPEIYDYGHRNVQGVAFVAGRAYSVEHGTDRDDEVNLLHAGANYGWDPRPAGGGTSYDESRPMTDLAKFPNAVRAVWTSGYPTIAPSGGVFLSGRQWGGWDGALAVAVLKGQQLRVFALDGAGTSVAKEWTSLTTRGRLRVAVQGPDGDLYLATDANPGQILRVHPAG